MLNFKTAEEMSAAWGVTMRQVQRLCREGKVDGALKRAGIWFIPERTLNPIKKGKAEAAPFKFTGTKKRIFDSAISLFAKRGYENVSITDLAERIGIRQSAVYNHFKSKQEILNTIYDFYRYSFLLNRPSLDNLETLIRHGSMLDLINKGFRYELDRTVLDQMADVTKIIIQRTTTDAMAAQIFRSLTLESGTNFMEDCLDTVVANGRLPADLDTRAVAMLINCIRLYTMLWWLVEPPQDVSLKILSDEQDLYRMLVTWLDRDTQAGQALPQGQTDLTGQNMSGGINLKAEVKAKK